MTVGTRFGKKLKVPSTFQVKHQFLLWWLERQTAKETVEAGAEKLKKDSAPMFVHAAAP
jgi:hypothetical protein